jgi:hypothetical protein
MTRGAGLPTWLVTASPARDMALLLALGLLLFGAGLGQPTRGNPCARFDRY